MKKMTTFNLVCTMNWNETEKEPFIAKVRRMLSDMTDRDSDLNISIYKDTVIGNYVFEGTRGNDFDGIRFTFSNIDQFISRFVNDFKGGWNLAMYATDYTSIRSCSSGTSDIPETETQSG